jgi:hypothetical protein
MADHYIPQVRANYRGCDPSTQPVEPESTACPVPTTRNYLITIKTENGIYAACYTLSGRIGVGAPQNWAATHTRLSACEGVSERPRTEHGAADHADLHGLACRRRRDDSRTERRIWRGLKGVLSCRDDGCGAHPSMASRLSDPSSCRQALSSGPAGECPSRSRPGPGPSRTPSRRAGTPPG